MRIMKCLQHWEIIFFIIEIDFKNENKAPNFDFFNFPKFTK